ncbi:MAG: site-specific integrase [Phycisphaeraceae bacterium]|nr:site-specific integrase [Phycisphaeraceae bacterium]MCW5753128.1 site-specific integrase [Phycisphaeraceae bacterium]
MAVQTAPKTTPTTTRKPPAYRQRSGYTQAIVTLTDAVTKRRQDYWLGEYGSPESRQLYYRVLAEYEALGRRLPDLPDAVPAAATAATGGPDVGELALQYWRRVAREFLPKRCNAIKATLRLLRQMDGSTRVAQYGPKRLRLLREAMISGDPAATPPRKPWSRTTVNDRVRIVVAVFRWGVTQEMVPASVADALGMLEPLKRGRSRAKEGKKVGPVPEFLLEETMQHLPSPVRAMVRLQLLTGARPGEIVGLRGRDIDRDGRTGLLVARLSEHKTAHLGAEREVYFGPEAETVLEPFLRERNPNRPLFSPAEAEAERRARQHARRKTPIGYGNRPGTNRVEDPERGPGDAYTVGSYRRAIQYACDRAFPPPAHLRPRENGDGRRETEKQCLARLTDREKRELAEWRRTHRWHPHQIRHSAATRIRREFGLEAAQLVLGHSSAVITDAVYAERDQSKVVEVIRRVG